MINNFNQNVSFKREHRQETIIYLALWGLLFMAPVMSLAIRASNSGIAFDWSEILMIWREYIPFFVVFLIHNHLLAPMLVYRQQKLTYIGLCVAITVVFQMYQCNHRPTFRDRNPRHEMMGQADHRPGPPDRHGDEFDGPPPLPMGDSARVARYNPRNYRPRPLPDGERSPKGERWRDGKHVPLMFGQHDVIAIIILILMLGMNVGIKLYFRQREDQKKLGELEKENLEQQLEYLRYQINPHFFMNTLNNSHALVDIDPEKAKQTILELSKMMRFVLYEGNKKGVPLDREITFLQNYITLMKLRYTDKVRITVDVPASLPNREVPPLMFITFVENAFKHGVSYRQDSFISVELSVERGDKLAFTCRNSKIPNEEDKHGGVGLKNVRQRLDLIYGSDYTLDIRDEDNTYTVNLTIPL